MANSVCECDLHFYIYPAKHVMSYAYEYETTNPHAPQLALLQYEDELRDLATGISVGAMWPSHTRAQPPALFIYLFSPPVRAAVSEQSTPARWKKWDACHLDTSIWDVTRHRIRIHWKKSLYLAAMNMAHDLAARKGRSDSS